MDGEIEELRASRDKLLAQIGQLQEKIGSLEDEIRLRRLRVLGILQVTVQPVFQ